MAKFYFREDIDECCFTKKQIIEDMKDEGLAELKIFEAERVTGQSYFWCTANMEVGEKGEGCGRLCKQYKPRNGKNGRCRYSGYCYEHTDKFQIIKLNS